VVTKAGCDVMSRLTIANDDNNDNLIDWFSCVSLCL
jgi:hypothetical protein